jgi:hypothetical protein
VVCFHFQNQLVFAIIGDWVVLFSPAGLKLGKTRSYKEVVRRLPNGKTLFRLDFIFSEILYF